MAQQPTQGRPKISARAKTVFTINGAGRYLEGVIPLAPDLEHIVFAFDFNIGRSLFNPGVCPITMYTRFPGETALTPSLGLPVSQVRIPKTDKERKLEVLFKRPVYERGELFSECNRGDEKFIAGVVSWKPEEKPAPSAAPPAAASPAPTAALEQGYAISTVNLAAVRGLEAHQGFLGAAENSVAGVRRDLDADSARLLALQVRQGLEGAGPSPIANVEPQAVLALFRN